MEADVDDMVSKAGVVRSVVVSSELTPDEVYSCVVKSPEDSNLVVVSTVVKSPVVVSDSVVVKSPEASKSGVVNS
jgi:hypothetical protein